MNGLERWGLSRRGTQLLWDDHDLSDLAARFGTPLFVVSRHRLGEAFTAMEAAFRSQGLALEIFFSVKTNPVPRVLEILAGCGAGAEVISEFELWLARKLGLDGDRILVNGTMKSEALLRAAVTHGAHLINIETLAELETLREIVEREGRRANIGLRINPGLRKRVFHFTTASGSSTSPIGFRRGSGEWQKALRLIVRRPDLFAFRGLHFHLGSGIREAGPYRDALASAAGFFDDALAAGLQPEALDIGGGFGIDTLKEATAGEALRLFVWNRGQEPPDATRSRGLLDEVADVCAGALSDYARKRGIPPLRLLVEPGRALSGPAQILLLSVRSVRERARGRRAAFCDAGAMSLSPLLISESHAVFAAGRAEDGGRLRYDIYGSLPTPLDIVSLGRRLPELNPGDVLAVMDTGAYFTSLGNNFAGPRPAIAMIENGSASLIRKRETFEDLVSRDAVSGTGATEVSS